MRARTWAIFILVNLVVSVGVILTVLFLWERTQTPAPPTSVSTATPPSTLASPATAQVAPLPSAPPVASLTLPAPLLYIVQEGDTLGAIAQAHGVSIEDLMAANELADPNVLHTGQTLVIPVPAETDQATLSPAPNPDPTATGEPAVETSPEPAAPAASLPTPLPTLTPSGPPLVEIAQALGSGNLAAEVVIVRNRGGIANLEGWTLSDAEGHTFTFPGLILFTDAQVRLHSAAGDSTPTDLYWGRESAAWKGGTLITLRDASGNVVDTYIVP